MKLIVGIMCHSHRLAVTAIGILISCGLWAQVIDSVVLVHSEILYFDTDQIQPDMTEQQKLSRFGQLLTDATSPSLILHAHADQKGTQSYNLKLSKGRMDAIRNLLVDSGWDPDIIESHYHGESQPISVREDEDGLSKNRRVTIDLYDKKKFIEIKGQVVDKEKRPVPFASIEVLTLNYLYSTESDSLGWFSALAPIKRNVVINTQKLGYFYNTQTITGLELLKLPKVEIPLPKIKMNENFIAKNLNFIGNSSVMLVGSVNELNNLKTLLRQNDSVCVEIAGHINRPFQDSVSRSSDNFGLSVARSWSIIDSLRLGGIDSDRLLARGYGNWEMLHPRARSAYQQRLNRRVEIIPRPCDQLRQIVADTVAHRERYIISLQRDR